MSNPLPPPQEKPSFWQEHWQKLIALVFWGLLVAVYFWYTLSNNLGPREVALQFVEFMQTPLGPLVYIVIYALRPVIFFPATVLTLVGGSIFGGGSVWNLTLAVLYTIIASNTSSMVAYVIGRYFGQGILQETEDSAGLIRRYTDRLRQNSFETVMTMRFIFLPYDLVTYVCGFLRIDWKAFILATALGSIPGTIAFVSFGASLDISTLAEGATPEFNPWVLFFGFLIFLVSIRLSRYFKFRERRR